MTEPFKYLPPARSAPAPRHRFKVHYDDDDKKTYTLSEEAGWALLPDLSVSYEEWVKLPKKERMRMGDEARLLRERKRKRLA